MTYRFIKNPAPGTNLRFARDTSGLPMDKLRCFWPFRAGGGGGHQEELMGNAPLVHARDCTGRKMLWSDSSPTGDQLGSCDLNNSTRTDRNGWGTVGSDPYQANSADFLATNTTPWAFTGWVKIVDADFGQQRFVTAHDYSQRGFVIKAETDATLACVVWQVLAAPPHTNVTAKTTDTFSDNTWAFFACGMDGTNVWAVINDGTPTTAACTAGPPTGFVAPLYFGKDYVNGDGQNSYCLDGNLADIAYWYNQGSFTSDQLADLYNNGNGNTLLRG